MLSFEFADFWFLGLCVDWFKLILCNTLVYALIVFFVVLLCYVICSDWWHVVSLFVLGVYDEIVFAGWFLLVVNSC